MGFLALGNEPWWTLKATTSDQILNIRVSPFYVLMEGIGLPPTIPLSLPMGGLTRLLLVNASFFLGLSAF